MRSPLLRKTPQVEFWFANCILAFPCLGQCLPVPGRRVVLLWFHSMPNSDVLDPRRDWNRRRLDNWRLNRRWRCRLSWWRGWCVPEIPLGHAPNSICARLGRVKHNHVGIALITPHFRFGTDEYDIDEVVRLNKAGDPAHIIDPHCDRPLPWPKHRRQCCRLVGCGDFATKNRLVPRDQSECHATPVLEHALLCGVRAFRQSRHAPRNFDGIRGGELRAEYQRAPGNHNRTNPTLRGSSVTGQPIARQNRGDTA